eukprot:6000960-Amphidinium_carterae.1
MPPSVYGRPACVACSSYMRKATGMLLEEVPIAVDSFRHSEPGIAFFCSHAHDDHLTGLSNSWAKGNLLAFLEIKSPKST